MAVKERFNPDPIDANGNPYVGINGTPSDGQVTQWVTANSRAQWTTPSGGAGALVFRERHVASSSATLDFTTFISASYDKYLIIAESIIPATNTADFLMRIGTGGGPTYDTGSNYQWGRQGLRTDTNATQNDSATGTACKLLKSMANGSADWSGDLTLTAIHLQSTALRKVFHGTGSYIESTPFAMYLSIGAEWVTAGTAVTALRFLMSSGNISSGSVTIYAYTNS